MEALYLFSGLSIIAIIGIVVIWIYFRNQPEMPFEDEKLSELTLNFHGSIVSQLSDIYGADNWKERVIVNAKDIEGIDLRNKHLKRFERGTLQDESILALLLAEINTHKKGLEIFINKEYEVVIS